MSVGFCIISSILSALLCRGYLETTFSYFLAGMIPIMLGHGRAQVRWERRKRSRKRSSCSTGQCTGSCTGEVWSHRGACSWEPAYSGWQSAETFPSALFPWNLAANLQISCRFPHPFDNFVGTNFSLKSLLWNISSWFFEADPFTYT